MAFENLREAKLRDPLDEGFEKSMKETPPVSHKIPDPLLKVLLYAGGPFFSYPHKPLMEAADGNGYAIAYKHFRRDHQNPRNLFFHCLCLVFQVSSNFSLLAEIDHLFETSLLSRSTSIIWLWQLLTRSRGAPLIVKLGSAATLCTAYAYRNALRAHWKAVALFTGLLEMAGLQLFVLNKSDTSGKDRKPTNVPQLAKLVFVRTIIQIVVEKTLSGKLSSVAAKTAINSAIGLFLIKSCQDPFGPSGPFKLGFVGWLLALLTDQPWLYWWSNGFIASVCQGISHHHTGEEGTLPQLAREGGGAALRSELSHATFFPNILLHSCFQSITTSRGPAPEHQEE